MRTAVLVLLIAATLLAWGGYQSLQAEKGRTVLAQEQLATAKERSQRQSTTIIRMGAELAAQQLAQQSLQNTLESLRLASATDRQHKQEIRRDDPQLRDWGAQPLPAAARRLHQRPAFTGADGYRQWMSGRHALHAEPSSANQQ
ncbi:DUF2570 domain-containing protein [Pseudomonas putida]|uniref:DUF2570 domain-containing protein n=1 Tax=Pseudomonas putida TaxID=303 RepID=UPI002022F53A|nr:DUF2570 domain-containing protein [Pseudomonas putida]MCL8304569.1 DUF2570 domain-containing protein [Pseudomonas putida]